MRMIERSGTGGQQAGSICDVKDHEWTDATQQTALFDYLVGESE
jgi:hypothetical protein